MNKWVYERGVEMDFSQPGKPPDKAKVESFNGRFRQECFNVHWFLFLEDDKAKIKVWREYCRPRKSLWDNETRLHCALKWATPFKFALQARETAKSGVSKKPEISVGDCYQF